MIDLNRDEEQLLRQGQPCSSLKCRVIFKVKKLSVRSCGQVINTMSVSFFGLFVKPIMFVIIVNEEYVY
jgi:hypothetical protein